MHNIYHLLLINVDVYKRQGVMCSNSMCDLNCVCSFRMMFLCVFVCLCISSCSRVASFQTFVQACRISILFFMFVYVSLSDC